MPPAVAERARVDVRPDDAFDNDIRASVWKSGKPFQEIGLAAAGTADGVRCFTLDPGANAARVLELLSPICGDDLELHMLVDLLAMDPLPGVGDTCGPVRKVSAFGVCATGEEASPIAGGGGGLSFEIVEFLASDDWLILCCHRQPSAATPDAQPEIATPRCRALLEAAAKRASAQALESASDLGMLLLYELTRSYSEAGRRLLRWMELWEFDFYAERASSARAEIDSAPLLALRGLGAEFGARLNAMDRSAHGEAGNWFLPDDGSASAVVDQLGRYAHKNVDRALGDVDRLNTMLRSATELIQTRRMADHLHLQQVQADRTEQLQVKVERITSLFLVPSLIAAFFGANTGLPGGNGEHAWESLGLMCLLMVVGAASVWIVLGRIRKRANAQAIDGAAAS